MRPAGQQRVENWDGEMGNVGYYSIDASKPLTSYSVQAPVEAVACN